MRAVALLPVCRRPFGVVRSPHTEEVAMPRGQWSAKRERQYEHIKDGLEDNGRSEGVAEEIAARTVNKERARHGEAKEHSRTSTDDISSGRRGGLRSHRGSGGRTKDQLYAEAKKKGIRGRSSMSKAELEKAVGRS
jgi:plasmid stabilization system protein ParE